MKLSKDEIEPTLIDDYKIEMNRLKQIQGRIAELEPASRLIHRALGKKKKKKLQGRGCHGGKCPQCSTLCAEHQQHHLGAARRYSYYTTWMTFRSLLVRPRYQL